MVAKLTYEFVKNSFEKDGYSLISKDYVNYESKLNYVCPNGHTHSISFGNWKQGYRCKLCAIESKRVDIKIIIKSFELEGYYLYSNKYINNKNKLEYLCPNNHRHYTSWSSWLKGCRCPYCSDKYKKDITIIRNAFEFEGYTLISDEYNNNNSKLLYICPNGNTHSITWHNWVSGYRCPCYKCQKHKYDKLSISMIGKYLGKDNPNWQGGTSSEKYCHVWQDQEYRQDIRDRDNNRCLNPYCNSNAKEDLTIHHIDYNKKNCHPNNLITICRSCNSKANKDRGWHESWYKAIMCRRYGYSY